MNTTIAPPNTQDTEAILAHNFQLQEENQQLKQRIAWFEKQVYGQKANRMPASPLAGEISLFGELPEPTPSLPSVEVKTQDTSVRVPKGHGRKPWPKHLERVEEIITPPLPELLCKICGCENTRIGEDVTEILERRPDPFFVRRVIRPKYACKSHPEMGVIQAKPDTRLIEKGNVGDSVVAQVILDKYLNHLPLTRQEKIFKRIGVELATSTVVGWIDEFAARASPIVLAMQKRILRGCIAFSDDTSIAVLTQDKPGATHRGAMWLYSNGQDAVVFEYSPGRSQGVPKGWLAGFRGYLHSDGYAAYLGVHAMGDITPVYCFAHARRKFLEALESGETSAKRSLTLINRLFLVDRYAREKKLSRVVFKEIRNRVSTQIVERLFSHWGEIGLKVLPQSLLGKALSYVQKRRDGFMTFLKNPSLRLDNNLSERELRRVVIGRKNYMFCGSEEGARRGAVVYSLAATCEMIGLNPNRYFVEIMRRMAMEPNLDASRLTPHCVAKDLLTSEIV